jgi:hypothetical protein
MTALGQIRPSCLIAVYGSSSSDSCRPRPMAMTAELAQFRTIVETLRAKKNGPNFLLGERQRIWGKFKTDASQTCIVPDGGFECHDRWAGMMNPAGRSVT